jgi:hypothetical protein
MVQDKTFVCVIDTGSQACIIKETAFLSLNLPLSPSLQDLYAFGNTATPALRPLGQCTANIQIDNAVLDSVTLLVVPDSALSPDILIGQTFLNHEDVAYLKLKDKFVLGTKDQFSFKDLLIDELPTKIKLTSVLNAPMKARLTCGLRKCHLGKTEIEYLGFLISSGFTRSGILKTKAIREFPTPSDMPAVQRFIGLTSFLKRFVHHYASIAKPLTDLTKSQAIFQWSHEADEACRKLVNTLTSDPVLRLYDPKATTELNKALTTKVTLIKIWHPSVSDDLVDDMDSDSDSDTDAPSVSVSNTPAPSNQVSHPPQPAPRTRRPPKHLQDFVTSAR